MSQEPHRSADVRMRGFAARVSVEAAGQWIDAHSSLLGPEDVPLQNACGRVLAAPVTAPFDVPSFDRSAMDGYAVRGAETHGAGDYNSLPFRIVGEALPGKPYPGDVSPGTTVRIMTGAPVPQGADAVVPAEFTREADGLVEITTAIPPFKNIGRRGEDVRSGTTVLDAGRRLRPQDLGLIASLGIDQIPVVKSPRIRLMITGNELVEPGLPRGPFQIYESNSFMLVGLISRDGGTLESILRLPDERDAIRHALTAVGADVILVSGGSSVGTEDHAPLLLAEEGTLAIHGVAMRPSSPAGMGMIGTTLVFLLPGNPVSCLCAYDFFASRALRRLGGGRGEWPYSVRRVMLDRKLVSEVGRVDYCRIRIDGNRAEPIAVSGASILSSTTRANGFVVVPAESEGYASGTVVDAFLYDRWI
jgi:molybdopterin molybdotransferase